MDSHRRKICRDQVKIWPFVPVFNSTSANCCFSVFFFFLKQHPPEVLLCIPDVRFHMATLRDPQRKYINLITHAFPLNWMSVLSFRRRIELTSPGGDWTTFQIPLKSKAAFLSSKKVNWSYTFCSDTGDPESMQTFQKTSLLHNVSRIYVTLHRKTGGPSFALLILHSNLHQQFHLTLEC